MKKILLLAAFAFASNLKAQVQIGLKGGITHAWQKYREGTYDESADLTIWRQSVSGIVNFGLTKRFSIEAEPGWAQRGSKCFPGWIEDMFITNIFVGNYIELPLLVQFDQPIGKRWGLQLAAGPNMAWLATANRLRFFNNEPMDVPTRINFGNEPDLNRFDYGLQANAGITCRIGPGKCLLDTRFYGGAKDQTDFDTSKNRSLDFRLGYSLPVGKK